MANPPSIARSVRPEGQIPESPSERAGFYRADENGQAGFELRELRNIDSINDNLFCRGPRDWLIIIGLKIPHMTR